MALPHCQYFLCMILFRLPKKSVSVVCVDSFTVQFFYKRNVHRVSTSSLPIRPACSVKPTLVSSKTMFRPGLPDYVGLSLTFTKPARSGLLFGMRYGHYWSAFGAPQPLEWRATDGMREGGTEHAGSDLAVSSFGLGSKCKPRCPPTPAAGAFQSGDSDVTRSLGILSMLMLQSGYQYHHRYVA